MNLEVLIRAFVVGRAGFASQADAAVSVTMLPSPLLLYDPGGPTTDTLVDLNSDGKVDFTLRNYFSGMAIRTEEFNRVILHLDPPPNLGGGVEALEIGYLIGSSLAPGDGWASSDLLGGHVAPGEMSYAIIVACFDTGCDSRMPLVLSRVFLGLEFQIGGNRHYGFFDVEAQHDTPGIRLYGWALETTPGRVHLLGVCLLYVLRRRRRGQRG